MKNCYGRYFGKLGKCSVCRCRKYCMTAADPPLLPREQSQTAELWEELPAPEENPVPEERSRPERQLYSRQEMLELIGFMIRLDERTLQFLEDKLQHPEFGYADMARKHNISRQEVHQFIRKRCRKIPELSVLLEPRSVSTEKETTFLEEVCRIRQNLRRTQSKKRKAGSNSLKRLTCSIRSLDLSKTSMFKGGSILRKDFSACTAVISEE